MRIESQRAKQIDAHLSSHPDSEVGRFAIEIGGEKRMLPFFRFPMELLCYNANNGRLAMDRRQWEHEHGRELDGCQREDAVIVRGMLLGLDEDRTAVLKRDIHQKGQMEPGVITHDGVVINGNRRMAVLELLHEEEPIGKWRYLEAARLPPEISEQDLWKIEAGLQLSKDRVAEYHPVNELLKIKEGVQRGLSPEEVASAMYAWRVKEVKEALQRLGLIDSFLEFFGQPGNYGVIKTFGLHEYFIDIQKRVISPAEREGVPKRELKKRLSHTFALIRAGILAQSTGKTKRKGFTHWDIRNLHKIFSDAHSRDAFVGRLEEASDMRSVPEEDVIEDFRDAAEILVMRQERDRPVRLIERAINALQSIDRESEHLLGEAVMEKLETLLEVAQDIRRQLADRQLGR